ncbi:MAG: VanZ family protein [Bacteroidetes bacterium]|nr:VanZ family protein [Bacteroidota bacterium]
MMIRRLWPSLVWAIFILILTGVPGSYFPSVVSFWDWLSPDKVVHIFIFGIQCVLILYAFRGQYSSDKQRYIVSVLIIFATILFALLTEVLQKYVFVGRNGSLWDFIADAVGVLIGFLAYYLHNYKKKIVNN